MSTFALESVRSSTTVDGARLTLCLSLPAQVEANTLP